MNPRGVRDRRVGGGWRKGAGENGSGGRGQGESSPPRCSRADANALPCARTIERHPPADVHRHRRDLQPQRRVRGGRRERQRSPQLQEGLRREEHDPFVLPFIPGNVRNRPQDFLLDVALLDPGGVTFSLRTRPREHAHGARRVHVEGVAAGCVLGLLHGKLACKGGTSR